MGRIALTGATGKLGSGIVRYLLKLVPASDIIVSLYNPDSSSIQELRVEVRRGDFNSPKTLVDAFSGASTVLIVSTPSMDEGLREKQHAAAIDAAIDAGAKRIVYTSLAFGSESKTHVMSPHLATERHLRVRQQELRDKITHTILREGVYAEAYSVFLGFINPDSEEVVVSGDGGVAWVARDDLAEATAKVLARDDLEDRNATLLLSGEKAYTLEETTKIILQARGKPLAFRIVSSDEYKEHHKSMMPIVGAWESTYPALEKGECAETSTILRNILGRTPKDVVGLWEHLLREKGSDEKDTWVASATKK